MENQKRNAKGEGSFKINADGTITHRKHVGYKANGNRKIITVTAKSKSACIKEMRKKEEGWKELQKRHEFSDTITVEELCAMHLQYQVEHKELKPKSIDRRECTIEKHIAEYDLGKMQIHAVKTSDIDAHIKGLINASDLSQSSIKKVLDVLNAAFNWARLMEKWDVNPVEKLKPSLEKKINKIKRKTAEEADVIILSDNYCKKFEVEALTINTRTGKYKYPAGIYGVLLLHTGMRCGEMLALRWRDVDLKNELLRIEKSRSMAKNREGKEGENKYISIEGTTKNEKARVIKLSDRAVEILKIIKSQNPISNEDDFICITKNGKVNTATNLEHRMVLIFNKIGLEKKQYRGSLHILRRTFATRMFKAGARIEEVAAYIGDLVSTTEKYYVAIREEIELGDETKYIVQLPGKQKIEDKEG